MPTQLEPATLAKLDNKVEEFIETVCQHPLHDSKAQEGIAQLHNLGRETMQKTARIARRLLHAPGHEQTPASAGLENLRAQLQALDPAAQGDLSVPRKLFGLIPLGGRLRGYFKQYPVAAPHISATIQGLLKEKDKLQKQNAILEQQRLETHGLLQRLEKYVYLARKIDQKLSARLPELEQTDAEKARALGQDLLHYLRQRIQDLQTQQAVTGQAYMAMDLLRRNNLELANGIERATTTTVSAFHIAAATAKTLTHQRLVVDQLTGLQPEAGKLMDFTASALSEEGTAIHRRTAQANVALQKLGQAFHQIYDALDQVEREKSDYSQQLLTSMGSLSSQLENTVTRLNEADSGLHEPSNEDPDA